MSVSTHTMCRGLSAGIGGCPGSWRSLCRSPSACWNMSSSASSSSLSLTDSLGRLLHGRHDGPGGVCVGVVQQARVRETAHIGLNIGFAKLFNGKLTLHSEHFELSLKFQILYFVTYIRVFIRYWYKMFLKYLLNNILKTFLKLYKNMRDMGL